MTTILLWSFSSLSDLLAVFARTEIGQWVINTSEGREEVVDICDVRRRCAEAQVFQVHFSGKEISMRACASPCNFSPFEVTGINGKDWRAAAMSFSSAISYCEVYGVSSYPATLNIWFDGSLADAQKWMHETLSGFGPAAVRGGIISRRELLDAGMLLSPNPWLQKFLRTQWPQPFDVYFLSTNLEDFGILEGDFSDSKVHEGFLYFRASDEEMSQRLLRVKQYADIDAANKIFSKKRGVTLDAKEKGSE